MCEHLSQVGTHHDITLRVAKCQTLTNKLYWHTGILHNAACCAHMAIASAEFLNAVLWTQV